MNKNNIIGFVLIGAIMFGFTWYQSRQYTKQMEVQAQLDSIAFVEQMAAMALDSMNRAETAADATVHVQTLPAYKDSMLNESRLAEAQIYKLSNDKIEVEFTTRGAQPYSVKINDYMTYDSTDLYLIKPEQSQYGVTIYAGENINTKDFTFQVVEHNDSLLVMQLPFAQGGYIQQVFELPADSYRLRWDDVKYEPGTLEVVVYRNGKEWARDTVKTTGAPAKLVLEAETNSIVSDGEDICYVNVSLRDAEGLVVPRVRNRVEFFISGPGEIVAVDNGDETDFEDFRRPSRRIFNGWAQVIVRAKIGATGTITVTAKADGLALSSATVKVVR